MHRLAWALNSSAPHCRGSIPPVASIRTRFACDRGVAASCRKRPEAGTHARDGLGGSARSATVARAGGFDQREPAPAQGRLDHGKLRDRALNQPVCRLERVGLHFDLAAAGQILASGNDIPRRQRRRRVGRHLGRQCLPRLEIPQHQPRIVADDFSGIQEVLRVEGVFDLTKDLNQLAILPAEELGSDQAATLSARDRSTGIDHQVVNGAGERIELTAVAWIPEVEKWPHAKAAVARVGVERPRDVLLLQKPLDSQQGIGKPIGGHGNVVDERDRTGTTAKSE